MSNTVTLEYWVECITENGIETFSFTETYPIDILIGFGSELQKTLNDTVLKHLYKGTVLDEGITIKSLNLDKDFIYDGTDFEPRLKKLQCELMQYEDTYD